VQIHRDFKLRTQIRRPGFLCIILISKADYNKNLVTPIITPMSVEHPAPQFSLSLASVSVAPLEVGGRVVSATEQEEDGSMRGVLHGIFYNIVLVSLREAVEIGVSGVDKAAAEKKRIAATLSRSVEQALTKTWTWTWTNMVPFPRTN
jgi:hypothetical protein